MCDSNRYTMHVAGDEWGEEWKPKWIYCGVCDSNCVKVFNSCKYTQKHTDQTSDSRFELDSFVLHGETLFRFSFWLFLYSFCVCVCVLFGLAAQRYFGGLAKLFLLLSFYIWLWMQPVSIGSPRFGQYIGGKSFSNSINSRSPSVCVCVFVRLWTFTIDFDQFYSWPREIEECLWIMDTTE